MNNYYNNSYSSNFGIGNNTNTIQQPTQYTAINAVPQQKRRLDRSLIMYIGIGIPLCVLLLWYIWSYTKYRYSSDRISGKLLKKYNSSNQQKINNETQYISPANIIVDPSKTYVSADMLVLDKETNQIISSNKFSIAISNNCSPFSSSCISL